MRGSADVSRHARPAFPGPAVRSHTDSILGVHLQVAHVHILEKTPESEKEIYAPLCSLCEEIGCE